MIPDRNNLAAIPRPDGADARPAAADRRNKAVRFMVDLIEGQQYILATRAGVLKLFAAFDGESGSWLLNDKNGQAVFEMDDAGRLNPKRAIADTASFTVRDLHEWADLA